MRATRAWRITVDDGKMSFAPTRREALSRKDVLANPTVHDDAHRGGFSGPVRADEAANAAGFQREVDVVEGGDVSEALTEMLGPQYRIREGSTGI